jgi:hypothetical protein
MCSLHKCFGSVFFLVTFFLCLLGATCAGFWDALVHFLGLTTFNGSGVLAARISGNLLGFSDANFLAKFTNLSRSMFKLLSKILVIIKARYTLRSASYKHTSQLIYITMYPILKKRHKIKLHEKNSNEELIKRPQIEDLCPWILEIAP